MLVFLLFITFVLHVFATLLELLVNYVVLLVFSSIISAFLYIHTCLDFQVFMGVQRFAWRRSREVKRHGRMCVSNRRSKEHFCAKHGVAGFLRIAFFCRCPNCPSWTQTLKTSTQALPNDRQLKEKYSCAKHRSHQQTTTLRQAK